MYLIVDSSDFNRFLVLHSRLNVEHIKPKKYRIFGESKRKKKKRIFDKKSEFLKFPQTLILTLRCKGLLKKKQLCEKLILKTVVEVSVYLLWQSSHVSAMANFKGTHTSIHVLKQWRQGR